MASEETTKIYPGSVDRYRFLREKRQQAETDPKGNDNLVAALSIAEELAGLAYILDGIRYAARKS